MFCISIEYTNNKNIRDGIKLKWYLKIQIESNIKFHFLEFEYS